MKKWTAAALAALIALTLTGCSFQDVMLSSTAATAL